VLKVNSSATGIEWGAAAEALPEGVEILDGSDGDTTTYTFGGALDFKAPVSATHHLTIMTRTNADSTDDDDRDYVFFVGNPVAGTNGNATTSMYLNLNTGRLYGAAWNDYAEYRRAREPIAPGHVVVDTDEGAVVLTSSRLQPGAQVVSDTYGFIEGKTADAQTPIAVAGRVLVYPYRSRAEYHAGMCVCSAPNGTVDIMTRDEIKEYPDCIVGIVSEIPTYETWGESNIKVDGRIWVRVK